MLTFMSMASLQNGILVFYDAIGTAGITHGKGTKSYLIMMAVRLLEMRRILKPKGTIYLHCDPEMSHYLKMIMDAIFGRNNFRSEIIWKRTSSHNLGAKQWPAIHDVILMYSQSDQWCWNTPFIDYDEEYAEKNFRYEDKRGKYSSYDLTGGESRRRRSISVVAWRKTKRRSCVGAPKIPPFPRLAARTTARRKGLGHTRNSSEARPA